MILDSIWAAHVKLTYYQQRLPPLWNIEPVSTMCANAPIPLCHHLVQGLHVSFSRIFFWIVLILYRIYLYLYFWCGQCEWKSVNILAQCQYPLHLHQSSVNILHQITTASCPPLISVHVLFTISAPELFTISSRSSFSRFAWMHPDQPQS